MYCIVSSYAVNQCSEVKTCQTHIEHIPKPQLRKCLREACIIPDLSVCSSFQVCSMMLCCLFCTLTLLGDVKDIQALKIFPAVTGCGLQNFLTIFLKSS